MKTLGDIKKIAVLGAGTMGPGIAQTYAMGGYSVVMWTRSEKTREKAQAALHSQLETFAQEGEINADDVEKIYDRVRFALTVEEAVDGADFIQETIVENRDAKAALYEQLAACVPDDVIIASNTSALNIFEIVPEKLYATDHLPLVCAAAADCLLWKWSRVSRPRRNLLTLPWNFSKSAVKLRF